MDDTLILDFVEKLNLRTHQGKVLWEKTSVDGEFQVVIGKSIIRICQREESGKVNYVLEVYNARGEIADTITVKQLTELADEDYDYAFTPFKLENIFKNARRKAFGVEEQLKGIMDELNKD